MAFSLASAPPLVKKTASRSSGARSAMSRAASLRAGLAWIGATVVSRSVCSWMAASSLGCWWPMFTFMSWLEKSRNRRPSSSQTHAPSPPVITRGSRWACADHEWNTWARSSR